MKGEERSQKWLLDLVEKNNTGWIVHAQSLSHVWLFVSPRTAACQAPPSMGLPRQEYWSVLQCYTPGDLSSPGIEPMPPALAGRFSPTEPPGKSLGGGAVLGCSGMSNSSWPHDCSLPGSSVHGDFPSKNTEVGYHVLPQGTSPTQGLNPGLPHWRQILYQLSYLGSSRILEWVAYPFSRESSQPRNRTRISCITGGFFYQLRYQGSPIGWTVVPFKFSLHAWRWRQWFMEPKLKDFKICYRSQLWHAPMPHSQ